MFCDFDSYVDELQKHDAHNNSSLTFVHLQRLFLTWKKKILGFQSTNGDRIQDFGIFKYNMRRKMKNEK
jgi:hypothetical protein